jgi:hypothetical protein
MSEADEVNTIVAEWVERAEADLTAKIQPNFEELGI